MTIPSLKELNRQCQKPRYKEVGNWMARHITRDMALPITWLVLHTPLTANQITTLSLMIAVLGILFLGFLPPALFLTGAFLLQIWYLLDHVDGQIARYRKTASLSGRFFDFLTHHVIHGALFFSLGIYAFQVTGRFFFVWGGFLTSLSMIAFNLIHDTKYKTFFEALSRGGLFRIDPPGTSRPYEESKTEESRLLFFRRFFSFLHKSCEIHVLMNSLTLGALLEVLFRTPIDFRMVAVVVYGLSVPFLAVFKISYLILRREIDSEFNARFAEVRETKDQ